MTRKTLGGMSSLFQKRDAILDIRPDGMIKRAGERERRDLTDWGGPPPTSGPDEAQPSATRPSDRRRRNLSTLMLVESMAVVFIFAEMFLVLSVLSIRVLRNDTLRRYGKYCEQINHIKLLICSL